jgi:titin
VGAGNVIGFNTSAGVSIAGTSVGGDMLTGNYVGTNASGANLGNSVGIADNKGNMTIGGTSAGSANVVGFNTTAGILMSGPPLSGDLVTNNFVGTNAQGANLGNNVGILVETGNNTIGGTTPSAANVIGFNSSAGIQFSEGDIGRNLIAGNAIGTTMTGSKALANDIGILVSGGSGDTIGGTTPSAANVISGNLTAGIELNGSTVTGTLIVGNLVGTNATGSAAVVQSGQTDPLQSLQNAGIAIIASTGNTIGGTTNAARNLISGNYVGVMFATTTGTANPNFLLGNFIGTSNTGLQALGNIVGVYINSSAGNQIGGTAAGSGNLISANTSVGVEIYGRGSVSNVVAGNTIGLTASGTQTFRNSNGTFTQIEGIFIQDSSNNMIGGTAAAAANVITGNESAGVFIYSEARLSRANVVEGNRIGLTQSGNTVPGNNGYGVLLVNAVNNHVHRAGRYTNRFGSNRLGNYRIDVYIPSSLLNLIPADRTHAATEHRHSHEPNAHPKGPAHHQSRRAR